MDVLRQSKKITRQDQIKWFKDLKKDKNQKLFAILEDKDLKKKLIGYCGLTNIDYFNKQAEISFLVEPKRAKNNVLYKKDMIQALSFLANLAFKKLKLKKIFTETYEFRKKHIKILEKFGFKKEGVLRSHVFKKGKFYNSLIHSLLKEEYKK